jgi:hypothetical protein
MESAPGCALASSIAARSVQTTGAPGSLSHTPSIRTSAVSASELTVNEANIGAACALPGVGCVMLPHMMIPAIKNYENGISQGTTSKHLKPS